MYISVLITQPPVYISLGPKMNSQMWPHWAGYSDTVYLNVDVIYLNEYGASNSRANRQLSGGYKRGGGTNVEKLIERAF